MLFWEGSCLWIFAAPPGEQYPKTDLHSHHVVEVTLALIGRVGFEGGTERSRAGAITSAPDSPHAFEGTGLVAHLFVASDGVAGRKLVRGAPGRAPASPTIWSRPGSRCH